jgi:hypothetical protein
MKLGPRFNFPLEPGKLDALLGQKDKLILPQKDELYTKFKTFAGRNKQWFV